MRRHYLNQAGESHTGNHISLLSKQFIDTQGTNSAPMRMPLRASIVSPPPGQSARLAAMASSSPSPSPPAPAAAPWRADFLEHTSRMPQASFVLSTVRRRRQGSPSPRARTCMLRGLWAGLPADDRNPAPRNRPVYESDCPVFTTDARMDKVADLGAGSGPGPVEAVWWVEATQTQWRVRGNAWLLGGGGIGIPAAARAAIGVRMRRRGGDAATGEKVGDEQEQEQERQQQQQWSWETEVTAHFGNLSPAMRGTFRNPAPGTPRQQAPGAGEGLGQRVDDVEDRLARRNFLVCVIVPTEVDRVLLAPDDPRRWLYRFRAEDGTWETVELWP
ncbi:hypothetical protein RB595_005463 [Gaeumannomyces hyphopodioides]